MSEPVSDEQIIALAAGELQGSEAQTVHEAIQRHPELARRVERLRTIIATLRTDDSVAPPPEVVQKARDIFAATRAGRPGWAEQLRRVVAELVFDSRVRPALAGFRGLAESFQLAYAVGATEVDLRCEPLPGSARERWTVTGQVVSQTSLPTHVTLKRCGTEEVCAAVQTDEHGVFLVEAPTGCYDLVLELPGQAVVLPQVELT